MASDDFRDVDQHVMNEAKEFCISTHLQLALPGAEKDRLSKPAQKLGTAGFAAIFPESADLNELALLSRHFGAPRISIDSVARKLDRPADELVAQLEAFNTCSQAALGIDLFEVDGRVATAAI
jgi:hypothetical protein